jgi:DNA-binding transcriptional MerR regulator
VFQIGEFSRIARVSCRLLRYYDEIGLLEPAHTNEQTGYRAYSASQLPTLNRILVLKELGLSLEQIQRVMKEPLPAAELRGMLLVKRTETEQALQAEAERLRSIETRIAQLESEDALDDVRIRAEPASRVLTTRLVVGSFAEAKAKVGLIARSVPKLVRGSALGRVFAIAHSPWFEPDEIDLEIGFFLERDVKDEVQLADGTRFLARELPVATLACCVRTGPPEVAHATTALLGRYIQANGFCLAGPNREVFLERPDPERMQNMVVEMQFPIERACGPMPT